MTMSPTALTLRHLRNNGWTADIVEHWIPGANIRRDLFGILDILALKDGEILGVQATSNTNVAARIRKIADAPTVAQVRQAGIRIEVWGWHKKGTRWEPRIVDVS